MTQNVFRCQHLLFPSSTGPTEKEQVKICVRSLPVITIGRKSLFTRAPRAFAEVRFDFELLTQWQISSERSTRHQGHIPKCGRKIETSKLHYTKSTIQDTQAEEDDLGLRQAHRA